MHCLPFLVSFSSMCLQSACFFVVFSLALTILLKQCSVNLCQPAMFNRQTAFVSLVLSSTLKWLLFFSKQLDSSTAIPSDSFCLLLLSVSVGTFSCYCFVNVDFPQYSILSHLLMTIFTLHSAGPMAPPFWSPSWALDLSVCLLASVPVFHLYLKFRMLQTELISLIRPIPLHEWYY